MLETLTGNALTGERASTHAPIAGSSTRSCAMYGAVDYHADTCKLQGDIKKTIAGASVVVENEGAAATGASQADRCNVGGQRCIVSRATQVQPMSSHPLMHLKDGGGVVSDADWPCRIASNIAGVRPNMEPCGANVCTHCRG